MSEKRPWSLQEDNALRYLKEELRIGKWSTVAQKMTDDYKMTGRSGKQCRERYHNYLDTTLVKTLWSPQEQLKLYRMHDQVGNKWAMIAQEIPGRTDNCVKNHFYSKLRKSLRKLNKIIHDHFKKEFKEIKPTAIYKIIQANQQKHKSSAMANEETINFCIELKNRLLNFSEDTQINTYETSPDLTKKLIIDINQFTKNYKRQPKKTRKASEDHLLKVEGFNRPRIRSTQNVLDESQQYDGSFFESSDRSKIDENQKEQEDEEDKAMNHQVLVQEQPVQSKPYNYNLKVQPPPQIQTFIVPNSMNYMGEYRIQQNLYKIFNPNERHMQNSQNSQNNFMANSNNSHYNFMANSNNSHHNNMANSNNSHHNYMGNSNNSYGSRNEFKMMEWSGGSNVEDMLRSQGLIQNDNGPPALPFLTKDGSKMSNSVDEQLFFDESEYHIKTFPFNPYGNVKKISTHEENILQEEK